MAKSDQNEAIEGDPERGDAILRRMLKTKPKPHKEAVRERKEKHLSNNRSKGKTSD